MQFSMITNHNLDLLFAKIEFIIGIGCYLNQIILITNTIDIRNAIGYNCDTCTSCHITMGINIYDVCGKNLTRAAPLILYKLYPVKVAILFIMQRMDESSLHAVLCIEFDSIPQLELKLFIESSNIAAYCATKMINTVCIL